MEVDAAADLARRRQQQQQQQQQPLPQPTLPPTVMAIPPMAGAPTAIPVGVGVPAGSGSGNAAGGSAGSGGGDPSALRGAHRVPMQRVLRVLDAIQKTPPGEAATVFPAALAATAAPQTTVEVQAALQRAFSLRPAHLLEVFSVMPADVRKSFHGEALALADDLAGAMPEVLQGAALLRWLMAVALPSLASLPEDEDAGTTPYLRKSFGELDAVARAIRPDETNPAIAAMRDRIRAEEAQSAQHASDLAATQAHQHSTLVKAGAKPEVAARDLAAAVRQAQSAATKPYLVAIIVLAVVVLGLILYVVITVGMAAAAKRKAPGVRGTGSGGNSAGAGFAGAGFAGTGRMAAMSAPPPGNGLGPSGRPLGLDDGANAWGFPPLPEAAAADY
jgi:hypothetical protein